MFSTTKVGENSQHSSNNSREIYNILGEYGGSVYKQCSIRMNSNRHQQSYVQITKYQHDFLEVRPPIPVLVEKIRYRVKDSQLVKQIGLPVYHAFHRLCNLYDYNNTDFDREVLQQPIKHQLVEQVQKRIQDRYSGNYLDLWREYKCAMAGSMAIAYQEYNHNIYQSEISITNITDKYDLGCNHIISRILEQYSDLCPEYIKVNRNICDIETIKIPKEKKHFYKEVKYNEDDQECDLNQALSDNSDWWEWFFILLIIVIIIIVLLWITYKFFEDSYCKALKNLKTTN